MKISHDVVNLINYLLKANVELKGREEWMSRFNAVQVPGKLF